MNKDRLIPIEAEVLERLLEACQDSMEKKYSRLFEFADDSADDREQRNYIHADISRLQRAMSHVEAEILFYEKRYLDNNK